MAAVHTEITPELQAFILAQPLFFVATAPLSRESHINLSPKGLSTFRILAPDRVAYLDLTGSGNETAAHLLENSRITFMFCAFADPPKIVRLYGRGRTIAPTHAEWPALGADFPALPGARQIVLADITRVSTSCGWGVPVMQFDHDRDGLAQWAENKGAEGIAEYHEKNNRHSIDKLPCPPL